MQRRGMCWTTRIGLVHRYVEKGVAASGLGNIYALCRNILHQWRRDLAFFMLTSSQSQLRGRYRHASTVHVKRSARTHNCFLAESRISNLKLQSVSCAQPEVNTIDRLRRRTPDVGRCHFELLQLHEQGLEHLKASMLAVAFSTKPDSVFRLCRLTC